MNGWTKLARLDRKRASDVAARVVPLVALGIIAAWATLCTPYNNGPAIRSDGVGHHAWTRALLDRDLSFCRWKGDTAYFGSIEDPARGFCQDKYPPGLALLRFPVMAFLVDRTDPDVKHITEGEHLASLIIGGVFLWLQGALMLWTAALLRLSPWRSALAVFAAIFGTGLFHYSTYDGSFSHAYSSFFCALLLWLWVREHTTGRRMPFAALAVATFFFVSLRNTNVLLLGLLVLAYVVSLRSAPPRDIATRLMPIAVGGGIAVALQLAYNIYANRGFAVSSYGDETFAWDHPMQFAVLFSYERGLFTYYPVVGVALVCGALVRRARAACLLLAVSVLVYMTLYGYWHAWYLGGGMGHRGFVELAPLVALVLCLAWSEVKTLGWSLSLACGLIATTMTLQVMRGYWVGSFKAAHEVKETYWAHMHTVESYLTGGTACRPSRCDIWHWQCEVQPVADYSFCMRGFVRAGNCVSGECAPLVALQRAGSQPPEYVTAPPPHHGKPRALSIGADHVGPWERFLMLIDPRARSHVRFISLASQTYVSAPESDGKPRPLVAGPQTAGDRELFVRAGSLRSFALKASNGRFVSPVPGKGNRPPLAATEEQPAQRFAIEYLRH